MNLGHNSAPGARLDVETLCNRLEELGNEWADAKAAADALDDATKGVLGLCFGRAPGTSKDAKEFAARNDEQFKAHLVTVDKARKRALRARVAYDVQQVRIELTRSNASTERALANLR